MAERLNQIALQFIDRFCRGEVDALRELLVPDLQFTGPLFLFHSRDDYLQALRDDPPAPSTYKIINVTEGDEAVAVFYTLEKPGTPLHIAQLFRFHARLISEIHLIFDSKNLV